MRSLIFSKILTGIPNIMKARWDDDDLRSIDRKLLAFADEDIELIQKGLAFRAAHGIIPEGVATSSVPGIARPLTAISQNCSARMR
jgi:hypothetical protein